MSVISADELHRTAKYFMDNGEAASHSEAMAILESFSLSIRVSHSIATSAAEQTALLTLVNLAARTFLGGVEVVGLPDVVAVTPLFAGCNLRKVVVELGGELTADKGYSPNRPTALIGDVADIVSNTPQWRLTWEGWRGGVTTAKSGLRLAEKQPVGLAPVLAAAVCAAEVFAFHSRTHPLAGRRSLGMSLWNPAADWLDPSNEPPLSFLPSSLWIIGLGNLGQAFAWSLASLDYDDGHNTKLVLQDMDRIASSNHSTSLLSFPEDVGVKKARIVAKWLDQRGFDTVVEERLFGEWTRKAPSEPGVALCGVDNPESRVALENAGFGLVVEAGLGAGLDSFRAIGLHTFPASRSAGSIWGKYIGQGNQSFRAAPAYASLAAEGMDECGLVQLASRTIAVPFVGLIAGCLVIAEVLRRLHAGIAIEVLSTSTLALGDTEVIVANGSAPYAFGFTQGRQSQVR